jgi:hypothetical protein
VRDRLLQKTVVASVDPQGLPDASSANYYNYTCISPDGRFVVFTSDADNLVPGMPNGGVFLHDLDADGDGVFWYEDDQLMPGEIATEGISVASDGTPSNAGALPSSFGRCISDDGRFVTFWSNATNLVAGDTNNAADVFVRDRLAGVTTRVSVASDGSQAACGGTNCSSDNPTISGDGRLVSFASRATNLAPGSGSGGSDSNGVNDDVFVADLATGLVRLASRDSNGNQSSDRGTDGSRLSQDGALVAFLSAHEFSDQQTTAGVDVFVRGPAAAIDRSGDDAADDTVLRVIDTAASPTPVDLCPADTVAVDSGRAVFLRPEAAGSCAQDDPDLTDKSAAQATGPDRPRIRSPSVRASLGAASL